MFKKFSSILAAGMIIAVSFQTAVAAAVIEIDKSSPDFKVESYQFNSTSGEECYFENVTETTPITTAAGVTNFEIKRFSASVKKGAANIVGDPPITVLSNGAATINPVFPFKTAMTLESFSLKFNNGTRQYFFIAYVSMDGKTWTEVPVSGAAKKVQITATYGAEGTIEARTVDCYASTPAGSAANNDVNVIKITLDKPTEAKYLKLTFFGNDNGKNELAVSQEWASFNSLVLEGSAVATAPTTTTPPKTTTTTTSPKTGDGFAALIAITAVSLAAVVVLKKKKA